MHILWLDVARYFVYMCPSLFFPFFFFPLRRLGLCSALMSSGGVAHVVATCLTPTGWEASFPVGTFSVSRIFQGKKRPFDINFSFLFYFPSCYSVTILLRVVSSITCVARFALCLLSFLLILRYVPYLNFISFLIFCLFEFHFSFFSAFSFGK